MRNSQKISYILPTLKPDFCAQTIVDQIESFEEHNYEIVIVSPTEPPKGKNVKHVFDSKCNGSLSATNLGYSSSDGDIIVVCVDDNYLPKDFLKIFDYFNTPKFKESKVKIANLCPWAGGPGKEVIYKKQTDKGIDRWSFYEDEASTGGIFPRNMNEASSYNIISFPVIFRETIVNHLGNVIWNERFLQCYADHWLGFYSEMIEENNQHINPKNLWMEPIPDFGIMHDGKNHDNKEIDRDTLLSLIKDSFHEKLIGGYNQK